MSNVTQILAQLEARHPGAGDALFAVVYDELRRLAAGKLAHEKPGQTLQATALVHEAYLRLVGGEGQHWNSRNHFFAAAAEAMRRILVDNARRKAAIKHGAGRINETLVESRIAETAPVDEIIAVHEALDRLAAEDANAAQLVKLHYFGGFSIEEAADLVGVSRASGYRLWTYARTWLRAALQNGK